MEEDWWAIKHGNSWLEKQSHISEDVSKGDEQ
jgi:hypothetical protein